MVSKPSRDRSACAAERYAPLYDSPLPAGRGGPLYNSFSYPTKIAPETVALCIAAHTEPGDTVLDPFGGSGATGLGALLCDAPTPKMKQIAKALGVPVSWGPRNAVVQELSTVGAHVASVFCSPPDPHEFETAAQAWLADVESRLAWIYEAQSPTGEHGRIRHVIWSEVLLCQTCRQETTFWEAAVELNPAKIRSDFRCESCESLNSVGGSDRKLAPSGPRSPTRLRVPVRVHGSTNGKNWQRPALDEDRGLLRRLEAEKFPGWYPTDRINWGDLHRSGYHQGIDRIEDLYTRRNLIAMSGLWAGIETQPEHLQPSLRCLALSFNASHSTLMTRVVAKKNQRDLVLTGAQSGVMYISGLPVEKNVFQGVRRKLATFSKAFSAVRDSTSTVRVVNRSSTNIDVETGSIDYVFTDPPFGDYIPYAELNQVNESWLGQVTDRADEAIISRAQNKGAQQYEMLLAQVFAEVYRALKQGSSMSLVFHSSRAAVWTALSNALEAAGFHPRAAGVLNKSQPSFKQAVSSFSTKGDALLLLEKNYGGAARPTTASSMKILRDLVQGEHVTQGGDEADLNRLYSRFVGQCVSAGVPIDCDLREFHDKIKKIRNGV